MEDQLAGGLPKKTCILLNLLLFNHPFKEKEIVWKNLVLFCGRLGSKEIDFGTKGQGRKQGKEKEKLSLFSSYSISSLFSDM